MSSFDVKLKKANDRTEIAHFNAPPGWEELAWTIFHKFDVSPENLIVGYIDQTKEAVFLANDEELQDCYKNVDLSSRKIKFVVEDQQTPDCESAFN